MKTTFKVLFFVAIVGLISSCKPNPEKLLIKKDGTWTGITTTTLVGTPSFTFTDTSDFTFVEGSCSVKDMAGAISTFTWTYDKETEQITSTSVDGTTTTVMVMAISEIEKDTEKWVLVSGTINGAPFTTADFTSTIALTRK